MVFRSLDVGHRLPLSDIIPLMKKAVVLTADKFEDMEVYVPILRLMEAGWQVDVAAPKKKRN